MISDFRAIRLRILRGVKGERKRLKFSKQSKAGKGEEKKKHQNQTTSSNSSGNVQGVIYEAEEMALFEGCHVWAL